jgi:PE family
MPFVITHPEALAAAAATTGLPPAAADEVSALTATQFSAHAAIYQAASAQAMTLEEYRRRPR